MTKKQTKAEQTYADQLADAIMNYETSTDDEVDEAAYELRGISPMEAQLADEKLHVKQLERGIDKLLAVNKALMDSLERLFLLVSTQQALKLAGELV